MSEETAVEATDPVEALPEEAQMDFSSALDAAFEKLENPEPEPEPEPETEPQAESEEATEAEAEEPSEEESEETKGEKEESESFDPTDDLDAEVGDDWTPKAASRFKQLKAELALHADKTKKYIIFHDTTSFENIDEESYEMWGDEWKAEGIGIWKAIEEFLVTNDHWVLEKRFTNNNGLTIIKRV